MKRLQLLLLAALALPTAVNAEPIPKISDYELLSTKGERFEFFCPKERYKQDGKIKKRKLYKECWFELNKDHMNFMDMQKIKREDIFAYWHFKSPHFNNTIVEHFLYYRFNGEIKKIIIHSKQKNFRLLLNHNIRRYKRPLLSGSINEEITKIYTQIKIFRFLRN